MAIITPFKAIHPTQTNAPIISSQPYDVVSRNEVRDEIKNNPDSFLKITRSDGELPDSISPYDKSVYLKAKENLKTFMDKKLLIQETEDVFYIYCQICNEHIQNGLVCCTSIDDYVNDIIKKHEKTREAKEIDRTTHMDVLNAHLEPVFLTYKANITVDVIIKKIQKENTPFIEFTSKDQVTHKLWAIKDKQNINRLIEIFAGVDYLYIADGHHRAASSAKVGLLRRENNNEHKGDEDYNYFLSVLFPDNQLNIIAYNRVVKDIGALSTSMFLEKLNEDFKVKEIQEYENAKPESKHSLSMYIEGRWYQLIPDDNIINKDDIIKSLDASILQTYIFSKILGISDPRTDKRLDFIGGIHGLKGLEKRVDSNEMKVAFALYPVTIKDLIEVADKGLLMPPKSTWFEPKLRSGLFLHSL